MVTSLFATDVRLCEYTPYQHRSVRLLLPMLLCWPAATAQSQVQAKVLEEIKLGALSSVRALDSLQYEWEAKSSTGWRSSQKAYFQGDRYRVERRDSAGLDGRPAQALRFIQTFDGETYQIMELDPDDVGGILKQSSRPFVRPYYDPLVFPYRWLLRSRDRGHYGWGAIRAEDTWNERFKKAKPIAPITVAGQHCLGVAFELPNVGGSAHRIHVFFAPELGYFPLRNEVFWGTHELPQQTMEVTRFSARQIEGRPVVLPLQIMGNWLSEDRKSTLLSFHLMTDESSVQFNETIDVDIFHLSPHGAQFVKDYDSPDHRAIMAAHEAANSGAGELASRDIGRILIIANVFLAVLLCWVLFLRRQRLRRSQQQD